MRRRERLQNWNLALTETLEERVVPSSVTAIPDLIYTAFPGEQNDVKVTPGFLTFVRDAPEVTVIPVTPAFSSNWLSAISVSVGVSLGVELSVSVPLIPFLLAQNGVYAPSISGAIDSFSSTNFTGSVANATAQKGASVVAGVAAGQAGNVYHKVTGSSQGVIDDYELYQVVADPSMTLGESGSITDISSAVFHSAMAGKIVTGSVDKNAQDSFVFNAVAGKRYVVMLDGDPEKDGKVTSTSLKISDLSGFLFGTPLQENLSVTGYNAVGAIDASSSGPLFVQVQNTGFGTDTSYRYIVLEVDPVADLVTEATPIVQSLDVPKAIPDAGSVSSTLTVSGFTGTLTDLNAKLNISHTFDSDLTVTLKSPAGTMVTLFSGVGGSGDNFTDTTFDDDFFFNPIGSGIAPFSSTYAPSSPLSAFNGEDPNGVWTLTVSDAALIDTGTLNSWSLDLKPAPSNDSPGQAKALTAGKFGKGKINATGEVDFWSSPVASSTDVVFSYVDTQHSTLNKDSKLTMLANDGTTSVASDDNSGPPGIDRATLASMMDIFAQGGVDLDALSNSFLTGVKIFLMDRNDRADLSALNTSVFVDAGTGDDYVIGGGGDDEILLGDGSDTAIGGPGKDKIRGGIGDDSITGGPGDDDLDGGDGSDTFIVSTDFSSTDKVVGGVGNDLFLVVGTDGDDLIRITIDPNAPNQLIVDVNGTISAYNIPSNDVEQIHVRGGAGNDKIIVTDAGLGPNDVVQYFKGTDGTSGLIKVGSNSPYLTFEGVEQVVPLDGPLTRPDHTARLVVFLPDPFEVNGSLDNDSLILATHLGAGPVINLDPTIAVPGDVDFYRFVASTTGTLDFQVYFEQNVGLPGDGNLDIQVVDSNGDLIASSTSSDDDERIRIPVVQGQSYYLKVFGATGVEVNTYDMTVITTPAPVPFNLELQDTQTTPPSVTNSDTGRSQFDNVTADNTPTILLRLADGGLLNDLPGNGAPGSPPDHVIPIPFNASTVAAAAAAGFRVAIFDENDNQNQVPLGFAQLVMGQPGVYSFTFSTPLTDGSHFISARVQMIDPATPVQSGFGEFSTSLEIVVDTAVPPTVQTAIVRTNLDLAASSDSGVTGAPATFTDRVTNDTTPTFFGSIEANSIVRVYATNAAGAQVLIGQTVATPTDGTNQYGQAPGIGHWELTSDVDLNSSVAGFLKDGLRVITATFEDLAGNISAPVSLNIFIDTQGPQVAAVQITSDLEFPLFQPKPSDGPTPRTDSLTISFVDPPGRNLANFPGLQALLSSGGSFAAEPGHYVLKGDANGIIPIKTLMINFDPLFNNISASATAVLTFFEPLPDDRYTLTIDDSIFDPAGNNLDGESNAIQPVGVPNLPSGDGNPGGSFAARFTIDSRSEIGVVGQGGFSVDINGNMHFDPANIDYVNRDLVFNFGMSTDTLFVGKFTATNAVGQDGFDRLGAYGQVNSQFRWLLDFDNDGRPDYSVVSGLQINGVPISGNFNPAHPGDEIGLFDGTKWYFDTNGNNNIDAGDLVITGTMTGLPVTGDFDGDGKVDLAVHSASLNRFQFDLTSAADGTPGVLDGNSDYIIDFSNATLPNSQTQLFPGVLERPFTGDFNLDGITDLGLMVPNRDGSVPAGIAEFFIFQSDLQAAVPGTAAALNHQFSPKPLGIDLYAQFGTNVSIPLVGNFDPPVANTDGSSPGGTPESAPIVTIELLDGQLQESATSPDLGSVRISRSGSTDAPLTVSLIKGGTATFGADVVLKMNNITITGDDIVIPAGQSFVDIQVVPLDDSIGELPESVVLTLSSSQNYQLSSNAQLQQSILTIDDDETLVTIQALDSTASESSSADIGLFRISRTGDLSQSLTVSLSRGGTAKFRKDYQLLVNGSATKAKTVVIPAGSPFVDVTVIANDDSLSESLETVTLTLLSRSGYLLDLDSGNRVAAVEILDNDPVATRSKNNKKSDASIVSGSSTPVVPEAFIAEPQPVSTISVTPTETIPSYSGTWNLNATITFNGSSLVSKSGTVQISQVGDVLTGLVQLQGLPSFKLKGKLDPENLLLAGKSRFPVEVLNGVLLKIRGALDLVFSDQHDSFTGQIRRSFFGKNLDVNLTAQKIS